MRKQTKSTTDKRLEILQALAKLLEEESMERITTAKLATALHVSEAALYRHFSKKSDMFDGLIDFVETSLLDLFAKIRERKDLNALAKIHSMVAVMLDFASVNKGICQVLTGHALVSENPALKERLNTLYGKFETILRQTYKDAVTEKLLPADFNASARASLVFSYVLGRWTAFVLTHYREKINGVSPLTLAPFTLP